MAEWGPPAQQPSRWSSETLPASSLTFPKEAQLQTATISLWTVVGAVQAVERTVEAQALRLLSLEQRSGMAEKRFADCEKAVAELGSQLESRWSALGTLLQEYGQLQRRLENMENLLKNFWVLRVPESSAGEGSKVLTAFGDISSHFSREKWENLEGWQKKLYKTVIKENCESLNSLDFAVSKLEGLACAEQGDPLHIPDQAESQGCPQEPPPGAKAESPAARTDVISWIKQEESVRVTDGCRNACNYYTVSKEDGVSRDRDAAPPCVEPRADLEAEASPSLSVAGRAESPASGTDVISWIKQEQPPTSRDTGGSCQGDSTDGPLLPAEEQPPEDPANPPLLLFFPGGSVAPILNGAIGESRPLSNLPGPSAGAGMDRPHVCLECGKTFSLLLSLQIHQMNHQKKKEFTCSYCGVAFSCPSELVRHQMIHTGERPYKCTVCGKGFIRKQHLIPHLRLHTGERPYHCAECGKDFICKHHLLEHQRTHTGERPYPCAACGKRFRRKKSLKDHSRLHGPETAQAPARTASRTQRAW